MPNNLIHESSPYLLQHAHNPVNWHPWNEMTLEKARSLDKMLLISIGYSACHWCHVMERESFEDEEVARLMNLYFICVKVDREERPDVDQVYMSAVQLITGSGGWPLNCFALPDGRPFFGGTYFRKDQWMNLLENIALLYETRRADIEEQAESLTRGIISHEIVGGEKETGEYSAEDFRKAVDRLSRQLDLVDGGMAGAPKFPMPVILSFLLKYSVSGNDDMTRDFLRLTLKKMAFGGIYDQVGGGFARYSTDAHWKVPHFEKMLYDNAQLVSVYSNAFRHFRDPLYKEVAEETLEFIRRELTGPEGGFYTALDADSEGVEGKYYTWEVQEFNSVVGHQAELVKKFYQVGGKGRWEHDQNILIRVHSADEFAREQGLQPSAFKAILKSARNKLLKARGKRVRPGLDNKILTSWNALMAKGFLDAYQAFGNKLYLETARENLEYILDSASRPDNGLYHRAGHGKKAIQGFLEDYAFLADALKGMYEATFEEKWLYKAMDLAVYATENFYDAASGLFFFTSKQDQALVARKKEIHDHVTPASSSVMAKILKYLGTAFDREDFTVISDRMLEKIIPQIMLHPSSTSNWLSMWMDRGKEARVVAVSGPDYLEKIREIRQFNVPGIIYFGSEKQSDLPYLQNRFVEGSTWIYYCTGKECKLPTENTEEIKKILSTNRLKTKN